MAETARRRVVSKHLGAFKVYVIYRAQEIHTGNEHETLSLMVEVSEGLEMSEK